MSKRRVISVKNIPLMMPLSQSIIAYLLVEHIGNDIFIGVTMVSMAILWALWVFDVITREDINLEDK